ncbi:MAG: hypothetical protein NWQ45_14690, partial [Congregibacter sp.]|nr:hypothetical protein [Congregibacter sp.]
YFTHSPYEALSENDQRLLRGLENKTQDVLGAFAALVSDHWEPAMGPLDRVAPGDADTSGCAASPAE